MPRRALGYLGGAEPVARPPDAADRTRTPGSYDNEGLLLLQQGRTEDAAAFERALALDPRHASALVNLSDFLFAGGRDPERSDQLLLEAVSAGLPAGEHRLALRATTPRSICRIVSSSARTRRSRSTYAGIARK